MTPATLSHSFSNSGEDSIYAVRHLRRILENAVLTHAEPSRKANDNSTGVYTLFGAVRTETGIQPVKLKVKEYRNVGQDIPEAVRAYFERNGTQEEYSRAYDSRVLSLESIEKKSHPVQHSRVRQTAPSNTLQALSPLGYMICFALSIADTGNMYRHSLKWKAAFHRPEHRGDGGEM